MSAPVQTEVDADALRELRRQEEEDPDRPQSPREACLKASAARAARALDEVFAVVGLTERYEAFYAMLAALLPAAPAGFWEREVARRENPSVHSSAAIQALLSSRASAALDRALRYERVIYDAAVVVHDRRCLAHLGSEECAA